MLKIRSKYILKKKKKNWWEFIWNYFMNVAGRYGFLIGSESIKLKVENKIS